MTTKEQVMQAVDDGDSAFPAEDTESVDKEELYAQYAYMRKGLDAATIKFTKTFPIDWIHELEERYLKETGGITCE